MSFMRLTLLGDSLAYGSGADRPEDTIGPRLRDALINQGFEAVLDVVAVPGAITADVPRQVAQAVQSQPDLAVVIVGANDLLRFVPPETSAEALGSSVTALRSVGADVLVVTVPDLSVVPTIPPQWRLAARALCAQSEQLQVTATTAAGGAAVRLGSELAPRFARDPALLAADRFHPSSAGYAVIAKELAPHLLALARRRRSLCSP